MSETQGPILLIDDEELFLFSAAEILRAEGYTCDCAQDAKQAIALLDGHQYAVVMTDSKIPGNENLEFFHSLSSRVPHTPIIIFSGHPLQASLFESVPFQPVTYLQKPFEVEEMLAAIRKAIASKGEALT